jgi:hypothetical protein
MKRFCALTAVLILAVGVAAGQIAGPPAPTGLSAELVPSFVPAVVLLTWNVEEGPWEFTVYRSMGDTLHFQAIVSVGTRIYYDGLSFPQGPVYYTVTAVMRHKDSLRVESERSNIVLVEFGTYPRPAKGILSGNVTDDSTGAPLRGALLRFARVSASGDKMINNAVAITDSLGVYRAILDTGGYVVHAEMPTPLLILSPMIHPPPIIGGYRAEWFDDVTERALATVVLVTHDDAARADFGLTRLHPPIRPTGTVAGTVTDDSTHLPVAGAVVRFYCRSLANDIAPVVFTDSLGHYGARLDTGTYLLRTEAPLSRTSHLQYTAEWFDDVSEASAATPLAVVSGSILTADVGLSRPAPRTRHSQRHRHGHPWCSAPPRDGGDHAQHSGNDRERRQERLW